jgi:DNA polymerase-3 subunit gamma/tau
MNATTGSHYTVLARRFRPQAFDDVVGQDHVSRALRNAIRAGRVAHAYIFTGARGVGKTSTARILAKALNCPNVVDGVPCNQCDICDGISAGNDVDVLEIDGASNRGIDDIRSLRANVGVRSMRTQFKVYIIDEVHMLTREAFNALLKTLEEPPPNVKFVFCTTEPNKVPDTILSRCQRFDFSSINDRSIGDRLREIAAAEGFEVAEDALELVARRARGSMRDSQSLFDQLLAFSDGTVSAEDVHRMLGTAGDERLLELFDAIIEHRPGEVLAQLDIAFGTGVQPGELMDQCIGYVRDLMVTLSGGDAVGLASVANRHRETLMQQASRLGMHSVMAAFQILSDAKNQMFRSTFARTVLEMGMVQLSLLENLTAISELLSGRLPTLPELPAGSVATNISSTGQSNTANVEKKNIDHLIPPATKKPVPLDVLPELDEYEHESESDDSDDDPGHMPATSLSTITASTPPPR